MDRERLRQGAALLCAAAILGLIYFATRPGAGEDPSDIASALGGGAALFALLGLGLFLIGLVSSKGDR